MTRGDKRGKDDMLKSSERAALRAEANRLQAILQIGKGGIEENLIRQVDDALEARELIKLRVLESSPVEAREAASELAEAANADVVQVIGRALVLWRRSTGKNRKNGGADNAAKQC